MRSRRSGAASLSLLLLALAFAADAVALGRVVPPGRWWPALVFPDPAHIAEVVAAYAVLPRAAAALLTGAALGLAGALLQIALRNPLASPSTLGISAGAHLALTTATLFAPGAMILLGRDAVAFAGGTGAVAIVLAMTWRGGLAPVPVILGGLALSLYAGAVSTVLVLLHSHQLGGMFIWSSGSLVQLGWGVSGSLAWRLALACAATALIQRPLRLLDLPDDAAQGLGVPVPVIRLTGLAVAVALSGSVVSQVGVIAFVGLAAPILVRLAGGGQHSLVWAPVAGAGLLGLTDRLVIALSDMTETPLPTGAMTALLGAPLLLWVLARGTGRPDGPVDPGRIRRLPRASPTLLSVGLLLVILMAAALTLGHTLHGWDWGGPGLPLRAPRVFAAAAAGAMLSVAGVVLQRMLGNPAASPEVLGLSTGTMVGLTAALWFGFGSAPVRLLSGMGGAAFVLGCLIAFARGGALPERILLAGIALGAAFDGLLALLLASGDPRAETVLAWISGSTYGVDAPLAWMAGGLALALLLSAALAARWLDLLPLGDPVARALGLPPVAVRGLLLVLVAALTGIATLLVGPLSFVGLIGPHLARLLGLARGGMQAAGAALCGAAVMVAADWLGRTVLFPAEIPAGLAAAMLGGPVLLWALARRPA